MRSRTLISLLALPALLALMPAGCLVGPNYKRPPVAVPDTFRAAPADIAPTTVSFGDQKWWDVFQDPHSRH